ncbi:MoaB/Mog domain-containing protein [Choanephora cucurbitarum]|nr:MoaB/Mog domain-containing protein [Choanephora cucurbitarum]
MTTAACCVIGDEILSGKTQDTNSHYLAKTLFQLGIELKTIQVVGDDQQAIAQSIRELASAYDIVFTSGGIGPTHDDITFASVAYAFGLEMRLDQDTYDYIKLQAEKRGQKLTKYHAAMATFPYPARLIRVAKIPIVMVKNVYILPGIPRLFELLVDLLRSSLPSSSQFYRYQIATNKPEATVADILDRFQTEMADPLGIKIGSYPVWNKHLIVTVSGRNKQHLLDIRQALMQAVEGWVYESNQL